MSLKLKNGLIHALSYLLATTGTAVILIFQYFSNKNQAPTAIKIAVPFLLALLIFFLVYYKFIKEKIKRKLIAVETARELGSKGRTNSIVANLLETIGIIIPLTLIGGIFVIGGKYLVATGIVLFEILGMYAIIIIGNILCDFNRKQEVKKKEAEEIEKLADKLASKVKLPDRYE